MVKGEMMGDTMSDTTLPWRDAYTEMQRVEAEYQKALDEFGALADDDDRKGSVYDRIRELQREYKALERQFRPHIYDQKRERIDLAPDRCMAVVRYAQQCSRHAAYCVGDLRVCTQHYKIIESGTSLFDLFDADGYGFAGHAVIGSLPKPLFWEECKRD